jgi:two-component system cell cycle sensor histidine kinase/response regulator CckA
MLPNSDNGDGMSRRQASTTGVLVAGLVAVVAVIVAVGAWFYRHEHRLIQKGIESELLAIAQLKLDQISRWRSERLGDARVLGADPMFARTAARWLAAPNREDGDLILQRFREVTASFGYIDVTLVDARDHGADSGTRTSRPRLGLSDGGVTLHPHTVAAVHEALRTLRPVLSDIHRGPEMLAPHVDVVGPVVDLTGGADPVGLVILRTDATEFLYPLIQTWPVPSRTAETLLVRRDDDSVLFLNELRHRPHSALELRIPVARPDLPAAMAIQGAEGIVRGRDYRGVEVLAVARAIPGTSWYMIAKIDRTEAFGAWKSLASLIISVVAGLILTAASFVVVLWQRNAKAYLQDLYEAEAAQSAGEARYTATLLSIGDGVIATDTEGRVELMNPVAETLTGWPQAEALGRPLAQVYRVFEEKSRRPIEDPSARILREGRVVGLANDTLLVARDGIEYPIADSGSPIHDSEGRPVGVVLVFRDQTEERRAISDLRNSERRHRLLAEHTLDVIWQMDLDNRFTYVNPAVEALLGYSPEEFIGTSLADHCDSDRLDELLAIIRRELAHLADHTGVVVETVMHDRDGHEVAVEVHGKILIDGSGAPMALQGTTRDLRERKRFEAQLLQAHKLEAVGRLAGGVAHDFNNMLQAILGHTEMAIERGSTDGWLGETLLEIRGAAKRSADLTRQLLGFARRQTVRPVVLDLNTAVDGLLKMIRPLVGEDIDLVWRPGRELRPVLIDPTQIDQILTNLAANARDAIVGVGKVTIETANVSFDAAYCADHPDFKPGNYVMLAFSDDGGGMDRETLEHLFEPFYTTKIGPKGIGLGLATVYGIVRQNEGLVNVYSEPGSGTTFRIYLPEYLESTTGDEQVPKTAEEPPRGNETVLVVEDELAILKLCKSMLERLGYTVLTARTPAEALRISVEFSGAINLLLTDVVMPEMSGRDLSNALQESYADLRCLFMSGYTANVIAHHGVLDGDTHFIQKPFSIAELAVRVRRAISG